MSKKLTSGDEVNSKSLDYSMMDELNENSSSLKLSITFKKSSDSKRLMENMVRDLNASFNGFFSSDLNATVDGSESTVTLSFDSSSGKFELNWMLKFILDFFNKKK